MSGGEDEVSRRGAILHSYPINKVLDSLTVGADTRYEDNSMGYELACQDFHTATQAGGSVKNDLGGVGHLRSNVRVTGDHGEVRTKRSEYADALGRRR